MSSDPEVAVLGKKLFELEKQATEPTLLSVLPSNVSNYIRRAAELLSDDDSTDDAPGLSSQAQRCMVATCSLQCALRSCEEKCRELPASATAKAAGGLMLFTEALRKSLVEVEKVANLVPPPESSSLATLPAADASHSSKRTADKRLASQRAIHVEKASDKRALTHSTEPPAARVPSGYVTLYESFLGFCGGGSCREVSCCGGGADASGLDRVILPRGAELAREAADSGQLPIGARALLESTAKALLSAAEGAVASKSRGLAARQFQRAALHLEILRLLGGRPLTAPLEESRRYARWRARHLSHLLENVVLEHGPEDPRTFEDVYEGSRSNLLGRGGYGVVFKVKRRVDGVEFACKQLELGRLSSSGLAQLHEEVNAMRRLDHPHVVRLIEVFYSERKRCYLIMELCRGGELFEALDRRCAEAGRPVRVFPERRTAELMRQMLGAIKYMHLRGVAHRDVKLENWLFDQPDPDGSAHLKLVDFGLAKVYGTRSLPSFRHDADSNTDRGSWLFDDRVGSAYYCAPEVLNGEYDKRCDLWSLGVIAYMLLCGAPPFWGSNDREILRRVRNHKLSFPPELFGGVSETSIDFVAGLLERDVDKRFTADQALGHEFIVGRDSLATVARDAYESLGEALDDYWTLATGVSKASRPGASLLDSLRHFAQMDALERVAVETAAALMAPDRLLALRDDFLAADTDGDGTLSYDELKAALIDEASKRDPDAGSGTSIAGSGLRASLAGMMLGTTANADDVNGIVDSNELERLFSAANIDGTKRISYREFAAAALSRRVELDDQSFHAAFDAIDSEGLGYISKFSILAHIGVDRLGGAAESDIVLSGVLRLIRDADVTFSSQERALEAADTDGDGRVDIAEFLDYVKHVRLQNLTNTNLTSRPAV